MSGFIPGSNGVANDERAKISSRTIDHERQFHQEEAQSETMTAEANTVKGSIVDEADTSGAREQQRRAGEDAAYMNLLDQETLFCTDSGTMEIIDTPLHGTQIASEAGSDYHRPPPVSILQMVVAYEITTYPAAIPAAHPIPSLSVTWDLNAKDYDAFMAQHFHQLKNQCSETFKLQSSQCSVARFRARLLLQYQQNGAFQPLGYVNKFNWLMVHKWMHNELEKASDADEKFDDLRWKMEVEVYQSAQNQRRPTWMYEEPKDAENALSFVVTRL